MPSCSWCRTDSCKPWKRGWTTWPAEVYGRRGERLEGYGGLARTGRGGPLDRSLGQRLWREPRAPGGPRFEVLRGYFFDPTPWDGSDKFMPQRPTMHVLTPPVKAEL